MMTVDIGSDEDDDDDDYSWVMTSITVDGDAVSVGSARRTTLCKTRKKWIPKSLPLTSSFSKK